MIFNMNGGGTALNFRVVGGTSAPSDPKENTIWVNTSTTITDWVFSATQPEAATGRVWFLTGASGTVEFNALKKNGIQVYPGSAKQYVNGAWVDKEAKSYQGGAWVELKSDLVLFDNGKTFDDITGGWEIGGVIDDGCLRLYSTGGVRSAYAKNKIDVTDYNTMVVTVKSTGTDAISNIKFGPASNYNTSSDGSYVAKTTVEPAAVGTYELDISNMSGEYYITVSAYHTGTDTYVSYVALKK